MLYQLSYFRIVTSPGTRRFWSLLSPQNPIDGTNRQPEGLYDRFSNPKIQFAVANRIRIEWEKMDSNHRRRTSADLQSAPFGHSGILPICLSRFGNHCPVGFKSAGLFVSRWRDSNPRPADYKSAALANWATSAVLVSGCKSRNNFLIHQIFGNIFLFRD